MTIDARRRRDHKRARSTRVYLDGTLVERCFYADGRRGLVRYWERDDRGGVLHRAIQKANGTFDVMPSWKEGRGHVTWAKVSA